MRARFNEYMTSHFSGCRVLVRGYDEHRRRPVTVHHMPGEFEVVGLSDGTDAWVAPVNVAPSALFEKVRFVLAEILAGRDPGEQTANKPRARVTLTDDQPLPLRQKTSRVRHALRADV